MNQENILNTTNAHDLLHTTLKPVRYLVDGFLPQGLHILAGTPKIGKSYLTLWLCMQIAKGKPVWDMPTTACDVLYISLEDTPERIQARLQEMTECAPPNMHLAVTANTLAEGLLEQLSNFMAEHPYTGLIVIDTLQKIRDGSASSYAADYQALAQLKAFADKHKLAILLIHHLRKAKSSDPFEMISGTTGITGAVDASYVMVQQRSLQKIVSLHAHGRDIPYQELDILFQNGLWNLIEQRTQADLAMDEEIPDEVISILLFAMDNREFHGSASELMFYLNLKGAANYFTRTLKSYADILKEAGFEISFKRDGEKRWVHIVPVEGAALDIEKLSPALKARIMNGYEMNTRAADDVNDDNDGKNRGLPQDGGLHEDTVITVTTDTAGKKIIPFPDPEPHRW